MIPHARRSLSTLSVRSRAPSSARLAVGLLWLTSGPLRAGAHRRRWAFIGRLATFVRVTALDVRLRRPEERRAIFFVRFGEVRDRPTPIFQAFRVSMLTGPESGPWHRPCNYERHDGQLDFNNYRAALTLKGDTTNVELLAHEEKGARQSARLHAHRADDRGGHHRYPRGHRDPAVRQRPDPRPRRQGPGRLPESPRPRPTPGRWPRPSACSRPTWARCPRP